MTVVTRTINSSMSMVLLTLATFVLFGVMLGVNYLAVNPSKSYGLFTRTISEVSAMYPSTITPAGWAFSIWGLIYLAQLAWILYSLALLCRNTPNGPAYLNPPVLTASFFIFFNLTSVLNISWLILWDRLLFLASFMFLVCQALALYLTVAVAAVQIDKYKDNLKDEGRGLDVKVLYVTVLNGVSMYATWVTIASVLNLGTVLQYKLFENLCEETVSVICLAVLMFLVSTFVALDMSYLARYTSYNVAPYFVVIWALAAIMARNWQPEASSSIIAAVFTGAISLAALIKVVVASAKLQAQGYEYRQMKFGKPN